MENLAQHVYEQLSEPNTQIDIHKSAFACVSDQCLLVARIASLVMLSGILVELLSLDKSLFVEIKFMSGEGLILAWLYFALVLQDRCFNGSPAPSDYVQLKYVAEAIFELALSLEVPITVVEWTSLFESQQKSSEQIAVEVMEHSVPLLLLLFELATNRCCFLRSRLALVSLYLLAYIGMNMIYSLTVEPVYHIISWKDVSSYLYLLGVIVLALGAHLIGRAIFLRFKHSRLQQARPASKFELRQAGPPSKVNPARREGMSCLDPIDDLSDKSAVYERVYKINSNAKLRGDI